MRLSVKSPTSAGSSGKGSDRKKEIISCHPQIIAAMPCYLNRQARHPVYGNYRLHTIESSDHASLK